MFNIFLRQLIIGGNTFLRMAPSGMVYRCGSETLTGNSKGSKSVTSVTALFIRIPVSYRNCRVRRAKRSSTVPACTGGSVRVTNLRVLFVETFSKVLILKQLSSV